jgi:hypothetical protein
MIYKVVFSFIFILLSCGTKSKKDESKQGYLNRREDIEQVKPMAEEYFLNIQKGNFEEALKLFSDSFFITSPKDKMIKYHDDQYLECGKLVSFQLRGEHSFVREGNHPTFAVTLDYLVNYEKCPNQKETLFFKKEKGSIIIRGHGH